MNTNKQIEDGEPLSQLEFGFIFFGGVVCLIGFTTSWFTTDFPIALMLAGAWFMRLGWETNETRSKRQSENAMIEARKGGV